MPDAFRSYGSPEEAVDDYVNFLKKNKRYEKAGVFETKTSGEYFSALQKAGYATDPEYAKKLTSATEGTKKKIASLNMIPTSSGTALASASTHVDDAKMAAMQPATPISQTAQATPPKKQSNPTAAGSTQTAAAYNYDIFQSMVGSQYSAA